MKVEWRLWLLSLVQKVKLSGKRRVIPRAVRCEGSREPSLVSVGNGHGHEAVARCSFRLVISRNQQSLR